MRPCNDALAPCLRRKILVRCDFTFTSRNAYQFATEIAGVTGGQMIVINAIEVPDYCPDGLSGEPFSLLNPFLAVMGINGASGLKEFFVGSVT